MRETARAPDASAPPIDPPAPALDASPGLLVATAQPFVTIGAAAIVAGGITAAVTGPTGWEHGSWVAAFLVLVVGVGQIGLGVGQATLADPVPSPRRRGRQAVLLDAGAALVVGGTVASMPAVVSAGSVAIVIALATFVRTPISRDGRTAWMAWTARAYRLLLAVLIVSTPIGLVLAWTSA